MERSCINEPINYLETTSAQTTGFGIQTAKLVIQTHERHGVCILNINHASQVLDQFMFINCSEKN